MKSVMCVAISLAGTMSLARAAELTLQASSGRRARTMSRGGSVRSSSLERHTAMTTASWLTQSED